MKLTENAIKVLEKRYLAKDETGKLLEDPEGMFKRVARTIASADKSNVPSSELKKIEKEFYNMMINLEFLPNSPTLMNAGRPLGQLSACFVLPIEDTMEGIFDSIKNAALIHKSGGGTGFSFSRLRPKGASVNSTGGVASGPISFMKVFNAATEAVKQGGTRRGANMGILRVDHPDIREFITCKQDNKDITNFNISVALTEEFMKAVEQGLEYDLIDPRTNKPVRSENAREIFDMIVENAWNNGEPGIIFLDRINRDNVTPELGEIESTNPCVTADTWVLTAYGPVQVADILGQETMIALNGAFHRTGSEGFFKTGTKKVIHITTDRGYELKLTEDHLVRVASDINRFSITEEWKPAGGLKPGDRVILSNNRGIVWEGKGNHDEGYLLGMLIGDGTLKNEGGIVSVWGRDEDAAALMQAVGDAACALPHRSDFSGFQAVIEGRDENRLRMAALRDLAADYGIHPGCKEVTPEIEKTGYDFHIGFIKGLFDCDGTVSGTQEKGVSVRLWQSDADCLKVVQRMLHRLGIASTIYYNRKDAETKDMPDDKGGHKTYDVKPGHELVISNDNLFVFAEKIGFSSKRKQELLQKRLAEYKRALNRERFVAEVTAVEEPGEQDVYDVQVPGVNAFDANGIYIHNCGEQPLLPYEACNLGSINLSLMVKEDDGKAEVDYDKLRSTVRKAVHFLDNVIDVNLYPLKQIDNMTRGTRKIGLGVMGWADMLCKLGIPYNSRKAIDLAENVMHFIQEESRRMSIELAEKKGVFPMFEKSIYNELGVRVRNATTTTIAPTGTLSIIAGCSSGIEPLFAISYIRNVMDNDELIEVNPLFRKVAEDEGFYSDDLMRQIAKKGSIRDFAEIPEHIREVFVTAHDISPEWHVKMQASFQKYTDNAVSKTVNLSHDATRDDVMAVFELAYRTWCKGVTIYRDGSREMQVLNIGEVKGKEASKTGAADLEATAAGGIHQKTPVVAPRPRPDITTGFTEKVKIGCGNLYITVNYDEHGICEVFTNTGRAGGCPSQSEATARLVSVALRSGIDAKSIVEQLKGIRCPSTIRQKDLKCLSCPDAIGRLIEKVLKLQNGNGNGKENGSNNDDAKIIKDVVKKSMEDTGKLDFIPGPTGNSPEYDENHPGAGVTDDDGYSLSETLHMTHCPDCGNPVEHEGGCVICKQCGFSKCG
jgi:ribonucleoside-diphosphate reductase alpha chain